MAFRSFQRVLALILILSLSGPGCAHIRRDLGTPLPSFDGVPHEGSADFSAILDAYGPPTKISALPAGFVFLYEHVRIDERQWGLMLPGPLARYFKIVYATSLATTDTAVFVFDLEGRLTGRDFQTFQNAPGGGFGFTLIFKMKSLTETEKYTRSQEGILDWGMAMTRPLPVSLNRAQSLDAGDRGLDILRVEGMAGQRALELNRQR